MLPLLSFTLHPNGTLAGSSPLPARIGNVDTFPLRLLRSRCWRWGWRWRWRWRWGGRHADEVGQHEVSRKIRMCILKRAVASSPDRELLVTIWINLECGHWSLRAA